MVRLCEVTGLGPLIENLGKVTEDMKVKLERGLVKAGLYLQRESQKIVPVQFGNLKASAFTRKSKFAKGKGGVIVVTVGYTEKYAVYVHENLEAAHGKEFNAKYRRMIHKKKKSSAQGKMWFNRGPNQQAKFLERPLRRKQPEMRAMIVMEMRKKK